jgi:hypothetical protein
MSSAIHALGRSSPHPVGTGIKAKKSYSTDLGKFALPNTGPGVQRLSAVVARQVFQLSEKESRAAHSSLLQTPRLLLLNPFAAGDWVDLNGRHFAPTRLRQLTLVSVFRHDDEALEDGIAKDTRFAGVATLTLALAESGGGTSDAWLTTTWHDSTRSLMSALEPAFSAVGIADESTGVSITVIFNGDQVDLAPAELQARIRTSAAVAGVDLKLVNLSAGQDAEYVIKYLSRQTPNQLFIVGSGDQLQEVADSFGSSRGFDRVVWAAGDSVDSIVQDLRERFANAVGVSPSLQIRGQRDTSVARKSQSSPFPFAGEPDSCLHLDDGRKYLRDPATGLYWTRDTAGHAHVSFKTYRKTKTQLTFESDRDAAGNAIKGKHKGGVLITIELRNLNPCSNSRAHKD